jgi:hypothetical protein
MVVPVQRGFEVAQTVSITQSNVWERFCDTPDGESSVMSNGTLSVPASVEFSVKPISTGPCEVVPFG